MAVSEVLGGELYHAYRGCIKCAPRLFSGGTVLSVAHTYYCIVFYEKKKALKLALSLN